MPAPKHGGVKPVHQGVHWVKKANGWSFALHYNSPNATDKVLWFSSETEARKAFDDNNQVPAV